MKQKSEGIQAMLSCNITVVKMGVICCKVNHIISLKSGLMFNGVGIFHHEPNTGIVSSLWNYYFYPLP